MWALHGGSVDVVEALTVGYLHLEFYVVSNVAILPHQKLDC